MAIPLGTDLEIEGTYLRRIANIDPTNSPANIAVDAYIGNVSKPWDIT